MTTISTPKTPLLDNTWLNQDSAQRLVTLQKMDSSDGQVASLFLTIAQEDEYEAVRCAAIARIIDLKELELLLGQSGKVAEAANQQVHRVIAGMLDSKLSEHEYLSKIEQLPANAIKQVALITKLKPIASIVVDAIDQNTDLADLCYFAGSVHVRKSAALKISDPELLEEILGKVTGKDKTVTKVISNSLELISNGQKEESSSEFQTQHKTQAEEQSSTISEKPKTKATNSENSKKETKAEPPSIDPSIEFDGVKKEAIQLSFKNTNRLFELRSQLRKLHARVASSNENLVAEIASLQTNIAEKITKNNEFQEQLKSKTEELLSALVAALETGNSEVASQCWDKIQGNISNTANQVRAELLKQSNVHKEKVIELRDWKLFAATEKKKELIAQMQQLNDSKMHASDRSKSISKMHKEWKGLGRSSQNEQLWKEFKKVSDLAYEPCKLYFKERKKLMAENLLKRREICDSIESEHKLLLESDSEPDISKLNKLLNDSESNWKSFAPIEQSKIKNLQKRYYGTVNLLRKMRKSKTSVNGKQKQELVNQAQLLSDHEDNKYAMNEAKRLQQEWKKVGPTSHREDQKYWQDFRAACDSIFSQRNSSSNTLHADLKEIEQRLTTILAELDSIASKDDAGIRDSRAAYQDLAQEFSNSLDPRIKSQRKRLLEHFNSTKRKIDSRFRALPDKRQQKLKQTILEKTSALAECEKALLGENDLEKFNALQKNFDHSAWNELAESGNSEIDDILSSRLQALLSAKSSSDLQNHCVSCENSFRMLCTKAEIRANVESPAEDKALRMKIQLEQLQSGFGQAKPDPKQNLKYAMQAEFESLSLGPLDDSVRASLNARLTSVLQKLR